MYLTWRTSRLLIGINWMLSLPIVRNMYGPLQGLAALTSGRNSTRVSVGDLPIIFCMAVIRKSSLSIHRNLWEKKWARWKRHVETIWLLPDWNHSITATVSVILTSKGVCRASVSIVSTATSSIRRKCRKSSRAPDFTVTLTRNLNAYFPVSRPKESCP